MTRQSVIPKSAVVLLAFISACSDPTQDSISRPEDQVGSLKVRPLVAIDLGAIGGASSEAVGLNNTGQVAGNYSSPNAGLNGAFFWEDGVSKDLGSLGPLIPGAPSSILHAVGITSRGQVFGYAGAAGAVVHCWIWDNDVLKDIGTLGGRQCWPAAANARGQVVGYSGLPGQLEGPRAFLWDKGVMKDLGTIAGPLSRAYDINVNGQVVGWSTISTTSLTSHAFMWDKQTGMKDLGTLGGNFSVAVGINVRQEVVGNSLTGGGAQHAFIWKEGALKDLGTLGGATSTAVSISEIGEIVGYSETADGKTHGFLWVDGSMRDLGGLTDESFGVAANQVEQVTGNSGNRGFIWSNGNMIELGTLGGASSGAVGINSRGQVAGFATLPSGITHAVLWTARQ